LCVGLNIGSQHDTVASFIYSPSLDE
jgi:hypothetical protein